jgi:hypothetical protein
MKILSRGYHNGVHLELWTNQGAWFWGLVNLRRNGGVVGAATSEAEAIREAHNAIEELSNTLIPDAIDFVET